MRADTEHVCKKIILLKYADNKQAQTRSDPHIKG